jgi:hypothetical protein
MENKSILVIEHEASLGTVLSSCLRELGGWELTNATMTVTTLWRKRCLL